MQEPPAFDFKREYLYQDRLYDLRGRPLQESHDSPGPSGGPSAAHRGRQWALLTFHQPVTAPQVILAALTTDTCLEAGSGGTSPLGCMAPIMQMPANSAPGEETAVSHTWLWGSL